MEIPPAVTAPRPASGRTPADRILRPRTPDLATALQMDGYSHLSVSGDHGPDGGPGLGGTGPPVQIHGGSPRRPWPRGASAASARSMEEITAERRPPGLEGLGRVHGDADKPGPGSRHGPPDGPGIPPPGPLIHGPDCSLASEELGRCEIHGGDHPDWSPWPRRNWSAGARSMEITADRRPWPRRASAASMVTPTTWTWISASPGSLPRPGYAGDLPVSRMAWV